MAKQQPKGKAMTPAKPQHKATSGGALAVIDMKQDAGAGLENTDKDSFSVPFLMIIQKGSPQVDRTQPEYIKGAEAGDMILSSTNEVFKEDGVKIVVCGFERKFLKWAPRDEGGGFRGQLTPQQYQAALNAGDIVNNDGQDVDSEGNIVRDTRVHYIMVVREDGSYTPAVLSMASTQVKKSKMLMTQIRSYVDPDEGFNPPSFGHLWQVTTVPEQNDKGNWSGWKILREGYVSDAALYNAAKDFHEMSQTQEVKLDDKATESEGSDGRV